MDKAVVRGLLKDQSDAIYAELHAQLAALHVELQAIKNLGLNRQGAGGGDAGLPRSMRLEVLSLMVRILKVGFLLFMSTLIF